jgi:predicted RNase H-like HicB family nuclease
MKSHIFSAVVEADRFEDGSPAYHAWCPALKGFHTWGYSEQEALARLGGTC